MYIAVRPNNLGHLELEPVNPTDKEVVRKSNQYDGTCIAYLQLEGDIQEFLDTLCEEDAKEIINGYKTNVDINEHTFRHMVGGQSD